MLNTRHRNPRDLVPVAIKLKFAELDPHGIWTLVAENQELRQIFVPASLVEVLDDGKGNLHASMPTWLAKNKELLVSNEYLPFEEPYP